jgi:hypothetical protein
MTAVDLAQRFKFLMGVTLETHLPALDRMTQDELASKVAFLEQLADRTKKTLEDAGPRLAAMRSAQSEVFLTVENAQAWLQNALSLWEADRPDFGAFKPFEHALNLYGSAAGGLEAVHERLDERQREVFRNAATRVAVARGGDVIACVETGLRLRDALALMTGEVIDREFDH